MTTRRRRAPHPSLTSRPVEAARSRTPLEQLDELCRGVPAHVAANRREFFEERAAISEHLGGLDTKGAEELAIVQLHHRIRTAAKGQRAGT